MVVVAKARGSAESLLSQVADDRLVELVRGGEEGAFDTLYERYRRLVWGYCRKMLGSSADAEDALQHTFMAAYVDMVASEKELRLAPWLITIARNHCFTLLRQRREQPVAHLAQETAEGPYELLQLRLQVTELLQDVGRLPEAQRDALLLQELTMLSTEEIGAALNVPAGKVKALVFQARSSLVATRRAREIDCADIRQQLSTATGGELRRGHVRRHLRECAGCRDYHGHRRH